MLGMTEMAILGSNIFPYIQRIVESGTICITPALAEYVFRANLQGLVLPCRTCFFKDTATTEIYTLALHDALPICSFVEALLILFCG
mgnify:CR=1 FL=1